MFRRVGPWVGLVAVLGAAVVGSNAFSVRDRLLGVATPGLAAPAASRDVGSSTLATALGTAPTAGTAAPRTALRSQPWWQGLGTLEGSGPATSSPFTVDSSAIQWRVVATCRSGAITVRSPGRAAPVIDGACTAGPVGYGSGRGSIEVDVEADGPWSLEVSQQVDTPLVEPPLPAMTAAGASPVGAGSFYRIDKTAQGTVTVYRQADGRYSLRLEDFFVTPNADLQIRLSPLAAPDTSEEFADAPSELVTVMDVTAGSVNYALPDGVDPARFRSVVIWCEPIRSAYAAASLGPPR